MGWSMREIGHTWVLQILLTTYNMNMNTARLIETPKRSLTKTDTDYVTGKSRWKRVQNTHTHTSTCKGY